MFGGKMKKSREMITRKSQNISFDATSSCLPKFLCCCGQMRLRFKQMFLIWSFSCSCTTFCFYIGVCYFKTSILLFPDLIV